MRTDPHRRRLLRQGGATFSAAWLASQWPLALQAAAQAAAGREQGAALRHLSAAEGATLEAVAARILPTTATPGAREAGVIYFIDASLGSWMAQAAPVLRDGVAGLDGVARADYAATDFATLPAPAQDDVLRTIEGGGFFQTARMLTLAGMFALPDHGGNRDQIGWALLGFDPRHQWRPPFGSYDAALHRNPSTHAPSAPAGSASAGQASDPTADPRHGH